MKIIAILTVFSAIHLYANDTVLKIESRIIEMPASAKLQIESDSVTFDGKTRAHVFQGKFRVAAEDAVIEADGDRLSIKGDAGIATLAAPQVTVLDGKEAQMQIGRTIQYFEKLSDGKFELKSPKDAFVGVQMQVTPALQQDGTIALKVRVLVRLMDEREGIDGVELPVGKPVFREHKIESAVTALADTWLLLGGLSGKVKTAREDSRLLVLLKVGPGK